MNLNLCQLLIDMIFYLFGLMFAGMIEAPPPPPPMLSKELGSVCDLDLVTREEWGARPPKLVEAMQNPVPYVIMHHSYMPPACNTTEKCKEAMRWMQDLHQINNGWNDIGYSFAVGGDGKVYVGRGWSAVGAHAPTYNDKSIGICLIGDWRDELPPSCQLDAAKKLIDCGIAIGNVKADYDLFGHRQVREGTECPGDRLFEEITTWKHFSPTPPHRWRENVVPT